MATTSCLVTGKPRFTEATMYRSSLGAKADRGVSRRRLMGNANDEKTIPCQRKGRRCVGCVLHEGGKSGEDHVEHVLPFLPRYVEGSGQGVRQACERGFLDTMTNLFA